MEHDDGPELSSTQMAELSERLGAARRGDRAPAALRARIEADRERLGRAAVRTRPRFSPWPTGGLAAGLAAAVVAIALLLPSGTPAAPTLAAAAALATRGPSSPAPDADGHGRLPVKVGGLAFPAALPDGFRATGVRRDRIDGRLVVTVFYAGRAGRVAYSIVDTPRLREPTRFRSELRENYYTLTLDHRDALTWPNGDHTCLISGSRLPARLVSAIVRFW